jgi:anthranilate synthase component 2
MTILLLDNFDSFTYNLLHYLQHFTSTVHVVRNNAVSDADIQTADKILISPGPGLPAEAGRSEDIIREYGSKKSILGVCLGHQAIATAFGGSLKNLKAVKHGISLPVNLNSAGMGNYLFNGIGNTFRGGRYHSWVVDPLGLPDCLEVSATDEDGEIMALHHKKYDIQGVQFHPESILSEHGLRLISNWISHEPIK